MPNRTTESQADALDTYLEARVDDPKTVLSSRKAESVVNRLTRMIANFRDGTGTKTAAQIRTAINRSIPLNRN